MFYVFNDAAVKKKLIEKYYDNSLSEYFKVSEILNLI